MVARIQFSALFFLISILSANTQTLTQAANEPAIGDVDKNYKLDTSAYSTGLPTNVSRNNAVWNFTKLAGTFPVLIDSFIPPQSAKGASAYPSASFSQHRDPLFTFFKSSSSPSQTELLGAYSPSLSLT